MSDKNGTVDKETEKDEEKSEAGVNGQSVHGNTCTD